MEIANPLDNISVLIVENEFLLAINLEAIMREAGARKVEMAATVADASVLIESGSFDAAILDIRLMDGDSLPLAAKLVAQDVPVVIHSGHSNLGHSELVPEAIFLPKPSTPPEIIQAVLKARGVLGAFELATNS